VVLERRHAALVLLFFTAVFACLLEIGWTFILLHEPLLCNFQSLLTDLSSRDISPYFRLLFIFGRDFNAIVSFELMRGVFLIW
jgi:hypothetical protein